MKKILALSILIIVSTASFSQEADQPLYLLFEFMQVDDHNESDYWEVESFWSEIHKQRVADNNILGWDLWQLTPGGVKQGSQFVTTTMFSSLEAMLQGIPNGKFGEYLKQAYPDKTEAEIDAMMEKTVQSRDLTHRVYCKEINTTDGDFEMKVGTIVAMDIMKQVESSYPKMEDEIFKPWHQEMVNKGEKGNWGLIHIILPTGSEAYGTHITYSMYENLGQLATSMENWGGKMDTKTKLAVQEGLKTREWKEVKIGRLVMMVR
ncbi:hypothetical protein OU798_19825 [Prolixibacteraceae bacterium Z1-6]|uniref:Uncharacterized protein n=1 Tax=Draconibacterium aestuarii TaxID=2998507 RepID=A0A9X3J6G0_9BACT|nr:hypothetical protein [Prolixibacteraceae bacterium Z1-6]